MPARVPAPGRRSAARPLAEVGVCVETDGFEAGGLCHLDQPAGVAAADSEVVLNRRCCVAWMMPGDARDVFEAFRRHGAPAASSSTDAIGLEEHVFVFEAGWP